MLLVLLRAVIAACERENQRVATLNLAELADGAGVVRQGVVREDAAGFDVGTHGWNASHVTRWMVRADHANAPPAATGTRVCWSQLACARRRTMIRGVSTDLEKRQAIEEHWAASESGNS